MHNRLAAPTMWLAAFALVTACGSDAGESPPRTTPTPASTTTPITTVSTTVAPGACSAARLVAAVSPQPGLPGPVAAMRADLARAAVGCDYDALRVLADRNGTGVRFSFGAATDPIAFWRAAEAGGHGLPPLFALRTLLELPFGTVEPGGGVTLYVWPLLHAVASPTEDQLRAVAATGLYPIEVLRDWVKAGTGYLGYRIVVGANGDWQAFVAGD